MTERVTVTSPRRRAGRAPHRRPCGAWAGPAAGPIRVLVREQARLALTTCAIVALVIGGLPVLFACETGLSRVRMLGVRLPWLILCVVVPVVWVAAARRHVRRAERAERDFAAREVAARGQACDDVAARGFAGHRTGRRGVASPGARPEDLTAHGAGEPGLTEPGAGKRDVTAPDPGERDLVRHASTPGARSAYGSAPRGSAAGGSPAGDLGVRGVAGAARPE